MENSGLGDGPQNMMNLSTSVATHPVVETTFERNYIRLVLEICVMIVILVGNSLTVAAIFTTPSLQTVTNRLVAIYNLKSNVTRKSQ